MVRQDDYVGEARGPELIADGIATLEKLTERIDQGCMGAPAFCMVLTGVNSLCFTARNGTHVIPVDRLAPWKLFFGPVRSRVAHAKKRDKLNEITCKNVRDRTKLR